MKQKRSSSVHHHWPRLSLLLVLLLFFSNGTANHSLAQSFPTFTPTPGPATNTPVPQPTDPSAPPTNTPASQLPTNTPPPGATATFTPAPGTPSATPSAGEPLPTAEPCSLHPTLQALRAVSIRQGPGTAYSLLGQLMTGEVRPVVGRAAEATWWVIELNNGTTGWVMNSTTAVSIQGYTGLLPIIEAPAIDGSTPTPGPTWQPTLNPNCTVTPTATTTPTPTATPIGDATRATVAQTAADDESEQQVTTPAAPETAAIDTADAAGPGSETIPTPAPLVTDPTGSSSDWLPLAGITLILLGIAAAFLLRRG